MRFFQQRGTRILMPLLYFETRDGINVQELSVQAVLSFRFNSSISMESLIHSYLIMQAKSEANSNLLG